MMRNLELRSVAAAIAAILGIGVASAADLPARAYTKAPAIADPRFDWSGFYVGGSAGGRWGTTDWTTQTVFLAPFTLPALPSTASRRNENDTAQFGGYFGYNWQMSSWVAGIEGDIASGNKSNTQTGIPGTFLPTTPLALIATDTTTVTLSGGPDDQSKPPDCL